MTQLPESELEHRAKVIDAALNEAGMWTHDAIIELIKRLKIVLQQLPSRGCSSPNDITNGRHLAEQVIDNLKEQPIFASFRDLILNAEMELGDCDTEFATADLVNRYNDMLDGIDLEKVPHE